MVANFLSRLHVPNDPTTIDNSFPDEHLFLLSPQNPWSADIKNYLTTGKMSVHFSTKERKLLSERTFNYSCITIFMFYTGPDQVMHWCIKEDYTYDILRACHDEPRGGHFAAK